MSIVAVVGDGATTTAVAMAAGWPAGEDDVLVVEADQRGGSLAAWLDVPVSPSLSTAVTTAPTGAWSAVEPLVRETPAGVRLLPAPVRAVEAARAVAEASVSLLPMLAARVAPIAIVDVGEVSPAVPLPVSVRHARVVVVVHRQAAQSAQAAAVRLERTAELVGEVSAVGAPVVLAVVGDRPFDPAEIADVVAAGTEATLVRLPDDPLAAAVIGGRTGVSARRLARLPLSRAAAHLAAVVRAVHDVPVTATPAGADG